MITAALLLLIAVVKDQSENVQAQEEKPVLTADRGDGVYMLGEGISFTCKTTKCRYSKKTVVLYKNGKEVLIEPTYYSERDIATFTIKATSTGSEYYSCAYSCRKVESDKSSTVLIKVVAPPEKPSLVPDRTYKFYLSDERITFTCTAKDLHPFSNYLLYKVGLQTPVKRRNYSWQRSATFNVTNTRAGIYDYYCVYTFSMLERNVTSEKSETVKITVVDRPPKPQILSYPRNKVYLTGESVILTCWINYPVHSDGTFHLYKNRQLLKEEQSQQGRVHFSIRIGGDASSEYSCVYTCTVSGIRISSTESDTMKITVVARPPRPQISSDQPDKVYVSDESVKLTCWITGSVLSDGTFYLYKNGKPVEEKQSQRISVTFSIANGVDASGKYSCLYTGIVSGTTISSEESNSIEVTVVAQPPKPQISSDRGVKVYLTNESVILTCQITDPVHCDGTFHLYNNQQYVKKEAAQQGSATFTITTGGAASSQYSCIYGCTVSGRNISSRESDRLKITVVEKSIQPWIPALTVVTLLLMLGVFGVYCWKKGKSRGPRELRAAPLPNDGGSDDIVYADLTVMPQRTNQKGKKKRFQTNGDDSTVYADIKL